MKRTELAAWLLVATPVRSAVTNPYLGEPVGVPAWIGVAIAVGSGARAWWEGRQAREAATPARTT